MTHIAENSPPVTLALIARIRELEAFVRVVPDACLQADKLHRDDFPELFGSERSNAMYLNEARLRILAKGAELP